MNTLIFSISIATKYVPYWISSIFHFRDIRYVCIDDNKLFGKPVFYFDWKRVFLVYKCFVWLCISKGYLTVLKNLYQTQRYKNNVFCNSTIEDMSANSNNFFVRIINIIVQWRKLFVEWWLKMMISILNLTVMVFLFYYDAKFL